MSIHRYTIRRCLYVIPVLFGVTLIVFLIFHHLMPDPSIMILGPKHLNLERMTAFRIHYGLDKPLLAQYADFLKSIFSLDLGISWRTQRPILSMIADGILPSLTLTIPIFILSNFASILTALLVSCFRGTMFDKFILVSNVVLMSIPALFYVLAGQWFFAYELGWFEIAGYDRKGMSFIPYIILPVFLGVAMNWGADTRFYRALIVDEIYKDYVRTARSKGLSEWIVFSKHILKNSAAPILTSTIIQIPFLVLGMILFESFFSIPGLGALTMQAISHSDLPVIKAMTIFSSVAYIVFNTITDILYVLIDPRIRLHS